MNLTQRHHDAHDYIVDKASINICFVMDQIESLFLMLAVLVSVILALVAVIPIYIFMFIKGVNRA